MTANYLIFASFGKSDVRDNHLKEILCHSREFSADRASLLTAVLSMNYRCKPIIQKLSNSSEKRNASFSIM